MGLGKAQVNYKWILEVDSVDSGKKHLKWTRQVRELVYSGIGRSIVDSLMA